MHISNLKAASKLWFTHDSEQFCAQVVTVGLSPHMVVADATCDVYDVTLGQETHGLEDVVAIVVRATGKVDSIQAYKKHSNYRQRIVLRDTLIA